MSDQWGNAPKHDGHGQQPYHQGWQPTPTGQPGYPEQPQQPANPYPQQQFAPPPPPRTSNKRSIIISGVAALVVIGGALGIYLAEKPGGSGDSVQTASTTSATPTASVETTATAGTGAQTQSAAATDTTDLLSTNQVCPAFLALEQPLISQMGQIQNEADGQRIFGSFQPKFNALAATTPAGQYKAQIQTVADDLNTIVAYIKANPHMSKPAPAAFDSELNTFQNDVDVIDNNCDPLGTSTS
jgi:hypothetical protein